MDPFIFDFWINCKDAKVIEKALKQLQFEIDNKLLTGVQYFAEMYLLKYLLS